MPTAIHVADGTPRPWHDAAAGAITLGAVSDRSELLNQIKSKAVIRGAVTLSSGQQADWYVDLRRVLLDGAAARLAGRVMLDLAHDLGFAAVGGLTLGAVK